MAGLPTITTRNLVLRPFRPEDAPQVRALAGDRDVAVTTASIPHPYEDGLAEAWIAGHEEAFGQGEACTLAVTLARAEALIGAVSLYVSRANRLAELAYWIGKAYWDRGYCTEAAVAMIRYGFGDLDLNRIQARHMTKNPASGRVMQKAGMSYEGTLRQAMFRFGQFEDLAIFSVLRSEWQAPPLTDESLAAAAGA